MTDPQASQSEPNAPSILSTDFHLRFFPALIKRRFGKRVADQPTSFGGGAFHHGVLVLIGGIAAASIGVPLYPDVAGWLLIALAVASVLYTLVISALEARGIAPAYESFLFPPFFFCLALGLGAGALAGLREPVAVRLIYACAGVGLGYWAGLLAGYHGQRLGFFAVLLYPFWLAGAVGALIPAILLLST